MTGGGRWSALFRLRKLSRLLFLTQLFQQLPDLSVRRSRLQSRQRISVRQSSGVIVAPPTLNRSASDGTFQTDIVNPNSTLMSFMMQRQRPALQLAQVLISVEIRFQRRRGGDNGRQHIFQQRVLNIDG